MSNDNIVLPLDFFLW